MAFRGGKALRGRKLNQREEELFKATSIVSNYLAKTKTLVEISRSYDEFIEGQGVAVELWGWLQDRGMAAQLAATFAPLITVVRVCLILAD